MINTKPYRQLLVWQKAYGFVLSVYKITERFPVHERYGMTSQLRRASTSIVLNFVEGYAKRSSKDFLRYLDNAKGSLWECECILELSRDLGYLQPEDYRKIEE